MSQPETNQLDDVFSFAAKQHIKTLREAEHPDHSHHAYQGLKTMWNVVRDPGVKFYPRTAEVVAEAVMEAEWLCVDRYLAGEGATL